MQGGACNLRCQKHLQRIIIVGLYEILRINERLHGYLTGSRRAGDNMPVASGSSWACELVRNQICSKALQCSPIVIHTRRGSGRSVLRPCFSLCHIQLCVLLLSLMLVNASINIAEMQQGQQFASLPFGTAGKVSRVRQSHEA